MQFFTTVTVLATLSFLSEIVVCDRDEEQREAIASLLADSLSGLPADNTQHYGSLREVLALEGRIKKEKKPRQRRLNRNQYYNIANNNPNWRVNEQYQSQYNNQEALQQILGNPSLPKKNIYLNHAEKKLSRRPINDIPKMVFVFNPKALKRNEDHNNVLNVLTRLLQKSQGRGIHVAPFF